MPSSRRQFLALLATAPFLGAADSGINGDRLRLNLDALSAFGRPEGGAFADGVSRVAYSDADLAGRRYVLGLMQSAGLKPRIDPAGNIFARRPGTDPSLAPVLFGSHIDSVPNGGNFDGDLGSLAALEVIRRLDETGVRTRRPLEMVIWSNEEGVAYNNPLCGSRAVAGQLTGGELDLVWNGVRKADAIRRIGGAPERIAEARMGEGAFAGYLELHIEQGGILDKTGTPAGIVTGIVAIDRHAVEIRGLANHSGTTPMPDRHDALLAAAHLTIAANDLVRKEPGLQVGTVGQLSVTPNAPNVIPGAVRMTVEFRDLSRSKIAKLGADLRLEAARIAAATRTEIDVQLAAHHDEALADSRVQESIESACRKLGLDSHRMPSGAGHDAQMMATLGPMGMIFIPSIGGISHSPRELSRWTDCANGANILLQSVLALAGS